MSILAYMGYYYYDVTYLLVILGAVLSMIASAQVNSTFRRYSRVRSSCGMTGAEAAERILYRNGLTITIRPLKCFVFRTRPTARQALRQSAWQHTSAVMRCRMQRAMHR